MADWYDSSTKEWVSGDRPLIHPTFPRQGIPYPAHLGSQSNTPIPQADPRASRYFDRSDDNDPDKIDANIAAAKSAEESHKLNWNKLGKLKD